MALGATLHPVPAAAAGGGGGVLHVTVRVVDACSVTSPGAGPHPRGRPAPPGIDHRCTGPVPPHRVTVRPAPPEQARAAPEHGPGRTAVRRTHEAGRDVVIVTVTY